MSRIIVLGEGSPAALNAVRKLRSANVHAEIAGPDALQSVDVAGVILTDGVDIAILEAVLSKELPVLAMGTAAEAMALHLGASIGEKKLYRQAAITDFAPDVLFADVPVSERFYQDTRQIVPCEGMVSIGMTRSNVVVAHRMAEKPLYMLGFSVEPNDPDGYTILSNFARTICGCTADWTMENFCEKTIRRLSQIQGDVLIAVSGGIDSAVCAALVRRAIGDRLHCVLADTGLFRKGESDAVLEMYVNQLHMRPEVVDAQSRMWSALQGKSDPAVKRRTIKRVVREIMREAAAHYGGEVSIVQGTLFTDETMADENDSIVPYTVIEPLKTLFKEEVRKLGEILGLPDELVNRQPFPMLGLAQRIEGEITIEKLHILREAESILDEEISSSGLGKKLFRYFCVLTELQTPGVKNGKPVRERMLAIRAVGSHDHINAFTMRMPYDVLERVVGRIVELPGINRVVYDLTPTPVADIEWN